MNFFENISDFFSKMFSLKPGVSDFLDIIFIAFIVYNAIKLVRETRAFQLIKGLILLGIVYFIINLIKMEASSYIFEFIFKNVFIIIVILFQQEIRQIIEKVGTSRFTSISLLLKGGKDEKNQAMNEAIIEMCKAIQRMSDSKTGSLIVMERELLLGDIIKTGTPIDAKITHQLIGNIFFPNSPLHDGAAIVREGRLFCAGCVLPLTKSEKISSDLGTRHRAAVGMSEQSDAVIIVTSEETGIISVAVNGELTCGLSEAELREKLIDYFVEDSSDNKLTGEGGVLKKLFKGKKK